MDYLASYHLVLCDCGSLGTNVSCRVFCVTTGCYSDDLALYHLVFESCDSLDTTIGCRTYSDTTGRYKDDLFNIIYYLQSSRNLLAICRLIIIKQ